MKKVANFEKISLEQFKTDSLNLFSVKMADNTSVNLQCLTPNAENNIENAEADIQANFENIKLPVRATLGSAGYDFFAPFDITLAPGKSLVVPTGIRAKISDGWVLMVFPRSGLGFKFRLQLDNTVGIIDSDYYNAANEGHIQIKISNLSLENKTVEIKKGSAFAQGVFLPFGVTDDDTADAERTGGFGSSGK